MKGKIVIGRRNGKSRQTNEKYIKYLENKVSELTSERDRLLHTFLAPKKKPFDTPRHSIELKLPDEIPSPFIQ